MVEEGGSAEFGEGERVALGESLGGLGVGDEVVDEVGVFEGVVDSQEGLQALDGGKQHSLLRILDIFLDEVLEDLDVLVLEVDSAQREAL